MFLLLLNDVFNGAVDPWMAAVAGAMFMREAATNYLE